jgi:hypothetical protein
MPINTNSGSSIYSLFVRVWRYEEILKVLIHELIHYYKIDTDSFSSEAKTLNEKIMSKFKIDGYDRCNEAFTELIAVTIHSLYLSCVLNIDVSILLKYETIFSLFQMKKILKHFKKSNPKFEDIRSISIYPKQTTSVFSYYIIKTLLLLNHEIFNLSFVRTSKTKNVEYTNFVKKVLDQKNNDIDDNINKLWDLMDDSKSDFIKTTMRMTALELNYGK